MESAFKHQLELVASTPPNNPNRHAVHTSLGKSYIRRFERFGAMEDIDSAIKQYLKAAASVPLNSVRRPSILCNLGGSYLSRYEWFENIQDLEFATEQLLEAVVPFHSIALTGLQSTPTWESHISIVLYDMGR